MRNSLLPIAWVKQNDYVKRNVANDILFITFIVIYQRIQQLYVFIKTFFLLLIIFYDENTFS